MGLFRLKGTVQQLGQCEYDNNVIIYAYIEIIDAQGERTLVKKVAVCTDVASVLNVGMEGELYFDEMFVYGRRIHSQLWGLNACGRTVTDEINLRAIVTRGNLIRGIFLMPFMGLGLMHLIPGVGQLAQYLTGSVLRTRFLRNLAKEGRVLRGDTHAPERFSSTVRAAAAPFLHTELRDSPDHAHRR